MQTLRSSRNTHNSSQKPSDPLTALSFYRNPYSVPSHKQLQNTTCAYHPKQRITNFCKDADCLLPLCPKCIKIHSEQHEKKGIFGNFDTIVQCFAEAERQYSQMMVYVNSLGKLGTQVQNLQRQQISIFKQSFQTSKRKAFTRLEMIFNEYEEVLTMEIARDQQQFSEQLTDYHDSICQVMESCKSGMKKLRNPHTALEGLIGFNSQGEMRTRISLYEGNLRSMSLSTVQMTTNDQELERILPMIKRYLHFGERTELIGKIFDQNQGMNPPSNLRMQTEAATHRYTQMGQTSLGQDNGNSASRSPRNVFTLPYMNAIPGNSNFGNYSNPIQTTINRNQTSGLGDHLLGDKHQTPLDSFSLQKSRNIRNQIGQMSAGYQ